MVGPKNTITNSTGTGTKYHAKNPPPSLHGNEPRWVFETKQVPLEAYEMILVRVAIAKVADRERLDALLKDVPAVLDDPKWNCVAWVVDALAALRAAEAGTVLTDAAVLDWERVRRDAMRYVQSKKDEHRFDGKAEKGAFDSKVVPTWSVLEGRELVR